MIATLAKRISVHSVLVVSVAAAFTLTDASWAASDQPANQSRTHSIQLYKAHTTHSRVASAHKRLIWSDNFTGPAGASPDPSKWSFDEGGAGWGDNELQYFTSRPSNATLNGKGDLLITARREKYIGPDGVARGYTSARLQTFNTFQFTYGLMEARIRPASGKGLLSAFWSLGNEAYAEPNGWPASGEIDTMEVLGRAPRAVFGTIHGPWRWAPSGVGTTLRSPVPLTKAFHTYGVRWSPNEIDFLLDGRIYKTLRPSDLRPRSKWPFQHPFFLLLNLAVGGDFARRPSSTTHFPARMVVDWVRVWQ
jgi:beta-glucanase (GH16 family)